ncbi:MAG: lipopolysaccharide heptosyltransferase I, partial [Betaproteobacteria bacterium]|nr:lipopolysaccharide heptosyltransferase I [Betaproteobacteria bacterium]
QAAVVIGVDTGLLHLASAVGVRCIGIYVATDPARNGLYPASVGLNLGGVSNVPGPDEVLAAVVQVTAGQAA